MRKLKIGLTGFFAVITLLTYQNCAIVSGPQGLPAVGGNSQSSTLGVSESDQLSAKANVILAAKCQACHNSANASGDFNVSDLNAMFYNRHIVPGEPLLSGLYEVVADGEMPPSPSPKLTTQEIQDIYNWIQDGFKDVQNTTPGTGTTGVQPTYASISSKILQPKCAACHGTGSGFGGISFASYNSTKSTVVVGNPATSALYISVSTGRKGGRMPQGGAALSNAELSAIQTWIQQGALNN